VPTPFYHLWIAQDLLQNAALAERTRRVLQRNRAAFLFGSTAPDVQVASGQPRQETHFFPYPIPTGCRPPVEAMLAAHPELGNPENLPEAQRVFIAGYLCHLLADWLWVKQIFSPIFGVEGCWGEVRECVYIHNVLRAYLDRQIRPHLVADTGVCMDRAAPKGWLPITRDHHLRQWRDQLSAQLKPNAAVQTVAVFAARQGLSVEAFTRLLDSEERMQREVFIHLSPHQIETYRSRLVDESVQLVGRYLEQPQGVRRPAAAGALMS
jgi:hypothetical protein